MRDAPKRVQTGIAGLDSILRTGLIGGNAYLVRGGPGTGKTTLGLHFLNAGVAAGEKCLFIALSESAQAIRANARTVGLDPAGITFLDLTPSPEFFAEVETYDIFSPAEVERQPITAKITDEIEHRHPDRVFIDSMTQFRYLAADPYQFRKQVQSFLRYLGDFGATVVFTSEGSLEAPDADLQFLSDGVINLKSTDSTREIGVSKFRGSSCAPGWHAMRIGAQGVEVFPRLIPGLHRREVPYELIGSGLAGLDDMLRGGVERGTVTVITGPTGIGKTSIGVQFMAEASVRGERSVIYSFEEEPEVTKARCAGIGFPIDKMMEKGALSIVKVEPLKYSADEFAQLVRAEIEEQSASIVMIDSIAGYSLTMGGRDLVSHLHALSKYMTNMGATVLLVSGTEAVTGADFRPTEAGISYLVDNIIYCRYFERRAESNHVELRRLIGILKKRLSDFAKTAREMEITDAGLKIHAPQVNLAQTITGVPIWETKPGREDLAA